MRILIDQDGVLADFDLRFWELCQEEGVKMDIKSMDDPLRKRFITDNILTKEDRSKMVQYVNYGKHRYFRDLPLMPGALEGVAALEAAGHDIWICTKPLEANWRCRDDKAEWIRRHFPHLEDKLILAPDKGLIKGDILLDDAPKLKWLAYAEWEPVVFRHPFNGPGSQWDGLRTYTWGEPIEMLTQEWF